MSPKSGQPVAVVMAKFPAPGMAKSRLSVTGQLTPLQAAEVARLMLRCVVLRVARRWPTIVATSPDDNVAAMEELLGDLDTQHQTIVVAQGDGTLGQRMHRIWQKHVNGTAVAFFGTDTPDLPEGYFDLVDTFFSKETNRLAGVGEAPDGGYWTLAVRRYAPELLENIDWSTDKVFSATCQRVRQLNDDPVVFPSWPDVDTFKDLQELFHRLSADPKDGSETSHTQGLCWDGCGRYDASSLGVMEELRSSIGRLIAVDTLSGDKMWVDGS